MYHCGMRQTEERHVANQVDLMIWSNRLDLLALSNFKGEVQVHRLVNWQKVWNFPPPKEKVTVKAMSWRPDGKALAIGYSTGSVYVVDVEDKEVLNTYNTNADTVGDFGEAISPEITCITWALKSGSLEIAMEYNVYDDASIFLQKPPSPSNSGYKNQNREENTNELKEIQDQCQLNMLCVGYGNGFIYMSVFGRYPYGTLNLSQLTKDEFGVYKILDIVFSEDFAAMQVFYVDKTNNNLFVALVNTSVLSAFSEEVFIVANKYSKIQQIQGYLDTTMVSITEAWEHILLEMDTKMADYAASVPEGGVSADLLELLMFGVASDQLELFLVRELTAKGLKKFGSSVEQSYSTIQKLVLKQLSVVGKNLVYYLAELRGLTRIPDRYKIIGIEESLVTEAIRASSAFLNKCLELQQVIDVSMRNYKAFFRWLFVVIVRLLDEQTPSEIVKIAQQDLAHIAEFLYNFDTIPSEDKDKPVKFNLERLGQYLQDQNLTILPDDEDNPWHKFLNENPCLTKDNETIFPMNEFRKFSLVQQQKYLQKSLDKVFDVVHKDIGKNLTLLNNIKCYESRTDFDDNLRVSQVYDEESKQFLTAFVNAETENNEICFMSVDFNERPCKFSAVKYYFSSSLLQDGDSMDFQISVVDVQFYSCEYLSVLCKHPNNEESTIFVQLPLKIALDNSNELNLNTDFVFNDRISRMNLSPLLDQGVFKVLDKMEGFRIAVSGGRKVGVVLGKSRRKVRVYEMEVDGSEDEDETFDTTPQSQNVSDASHGDMDRLNQDISI